MTTTEFVNKWFDVHPFEENNIELDLEQLINDEIKRRIENARQRYIAVLESNKVKEGTIGFMNEMDNFNFITSKLIK